MLYIATFYVGGENCSQSDQTGNYSSSYMKKRATRIDAIFVCASGARKTINAENQADPELREGGRRRRLQHENGARATRLDATFVDVGTLVCDLSMHAGGDAGCDAGGDGGGARGGGAREGGGGAAEAKSDRSS